MLHIFRIEWNELERVGECKKIVAMVNPRIMQNRMFLAQRELIYEIDSQWLLVWNQENEILPEIML